jgi:hypothetical protein
MNLALAFILAGATHAAKTYTATSKYRNHIHTTFSRGSPSQEQTLGSSRCPCIGVADVAGTVKVSVGDNKSADMPADVGAECKAWDNGISPFCKKGEEPGKDNGWCAKQWCYVDPCSCNLDTPPKISSYLPDGQWQGKSLWYSYATCSGTDSLSDDDSKQKHEEEPKVCSQVIDEGKWGDDSCRCIAIGGQPGTNNMTIGKTEIAYPADTGAMCKAWDTGNHPDCKEEDSPKWCKQAWCFVDPCSCRFPVPPKTSGYLPEASYQGRPLYYSYGTCGDEDSYTASERGEACVNQQSEKECTSFGKCAWKAGACLGKELVEVCSQDIANKSEEDYNEENTKEKGKEKGKNDSDDSNNDRDVDIKQGASSSRCPCIGVADVEGSVRVSVGNNKTAEMPADVGAECKAWDNGVTPSCKRGEKPGKDNGWCAQPWCYVDPCNCNLETPPKESSYLPDGQWQGKSLWYSYDTCSGHVSWSKSNNSKSEAKTAKVCSLKVDEAKWGDDDCRCIAISGQPGTNNMTIGEAEVAYPADTGALCKAWDSGNHPDCKNDDAPKWCKQAWCFVDPCSCRLPVPPKTSGYLPMASYQDRPLYYSYATCGQKDSYTAAERKEACVNQQSEKECTSFDKCAWKGGTCLGKELVEVCSLNSSDDGTSVDVEQRSSSSECPCIGVADVEGSVRVSVGNNETAEMPADVGAECKAWDNDVTPSCKKGEKPGKDNGWCAQPWCYVDPCNCNLETPPKKKQLLARWPLAGQKLVVLLCNM